MSNTTAEDDYHIMEAIKDMNDQQNKFDFKNRKFLNALLTAIYDILRDEEDIIRCQYVFKQDDPEKFNQTKFDQLLSLQTKPTYEQSTSLNSIQRPIKKTFNVSLELIEKILNIYQTFIKNHFAFNEFFQKEFSKK